LTVVNSSWDGLVMVKASAARRHTDERIGTSSVEIGKKIRQARQERGMTLAQLGGQDLSKSFLSLVESGRSRVSLRALEILAQRLDRPMSYFLDEMPGTSGEDSELALDRAEAALLRQDGEGAASMLQAVQVNERQRPRYFFLHGWALTSVSRPREALPVLEEGLALAEQNQDPALRTRLRYTLAMALYNAGNYAEALVRLHQALSEAMQEPEDPNLLGKITVAIGHVLYVTDDTSGALEHYARAREIFGAVSDLANVACAYSGMSLAYTKQGDKANALHYSKLSLGAFYVRQNEREAARELNNIAMRYKDLGDLSRALDHAQQAVELARKIQARDVEALAHSSVALVQLKLENLEEAVAEAHAAQALEPNEKGVAHIDAVLVLAELAEGRADFGEADRFYLQALDGLREIGRISVYVDAAIAYSEALRRRGDTEKALQYALMALQTRSRRAP
jgi:HTH-type transcriptional regulator, quorum sensing regulator NprR